MKKIFVVGGGPSLRGFDFSSLDKVETIAVNESLFDLGNPTYFVTMDSSFLIKLRGRKKEYEIFLSTKAKKYFINPRMLGTFPGIDEVIKSEIIQPFDDEKFGHGYNSGFCAVQLALRLGYDKIYLLGIDMTTDGTDHYHDKYRVRPNYKHILAPYCKIFMESLLELPDKDRIISCSKISKLNEAIKYQHISEVL